MSVVVLSCILQNDKNGKSEYPKSVFFIVGNEFCERFSYYGMRGASHLNILLLVFVRKIFHSSHSKFRLHFRHFVFLWFFTIDLDRSTGGTNHLMLFKTLKRFALSLTRSDKLPLNDGQKFVYCYMSGMECSFFQ